MRDHLIIVALGVAVGLVVGAAGGAIIFPGTTPPPPPVASTLAPGSTTDGPTGSLPPCITEDAFGCYCDVSEQGDGTGQDFVSPVGETEADIVTEAAPPPTSDEIGTTEDPGDQPVDEARQDWETGTL